MNSGLFFCKLCKISLTDATILGLAGCKGEFNAAFATLKDKTIPVITKIIFKNKIIISTPKIPFKIDLNYLKKVEEKHGIDFHTAQGLWNDSDLVEIPAKTIDEPRSIVIAMLDGKHWSGVITYRGSTIRIISVRRARKSEVELYESA